jgi:predicted ATP-binding protein involved in virulence
MLVLSDARKRQKLVNRRKQTRGTDATLKHYTCAPKHRKEIFWKHNQLSQRDTLPLLGYHSIKRMVSEKVADYKKKISPMYLVHLLP